MRVLCLTICTVDSEKFSSVWYVVDLFISDRYVRVSVWSFVRPVMTNAKVKKAKDWKIPVVNVQWLSELVMGHFVALKFPDSAKYQDFSAEDPFRLDYSLVPELMSKFLLIINYPVHYYEVLSIESIIFTLLARNCSLLLFFSLKYLRASTANCSNFLTNG